MCSTVAQSCCSKQFEGFRLVPKRAANSRQKISAVRFDRTALFLLSALTRARGCLHDVQGLWASGWREGFVELFQLLSA
ncbi:hypothetical protein R84865_001760 [Carnimonas sp. R-84865]